MSAAGSPPTAHGRYKEFLALLRALHLLMVQGADDAPEADATRDAMEDLYYGLDQAEVEQARWLSEDLYSLEGRVPLAQQQVSYPAGSAAARLFSAGAQGDWDDVLQALRPHLSRLPEDRVACVRAGAWLEMDEPETAQLFLSTAARLALRACADALDEEKERVAAPRRRPDRPPFFEPRQ